MRSLAESGYEPFEERDGIRLRNCPFHGLRSKNESLVCQMNLALINGIVQGADARGWAPSLEPSDDDCCVALRREPKAAQGLKRMGERVASPLSDPTERTYVLAFPGKDSQKNSKNGSHPNGPPSDRLHGSGLNGNGALVHEREPDLHSLGLHAPALELPDVSHLRRIDPETWSRLEAKMAEIFEALGLDLNKPGTARTPERFLRAMYDATSGYDGDPKLVALFPAESPNGSRRGLSQVVEGPVSFYALCEHHALPFFGKACIGYIARDHLVGISKLTRLVRLYAKRFTLQERLGRQITDALAKLADPHGVAVHLEASPCARG